MDKKLNIEVGNDIKEDNLISPLDNSENSLIFYKHLDFYKETFYNLDILSLSTILDNQALINENQQLKNQNAEYESKIRYFNNLEKTKPYKLAHIIRKFAQTLRNLFK